jgi:hypothetical protein
MPTWLGKHGEHVRFHGCLFLIAVAAFASACGKPAASGPRAYTPLFPAAVDAARAHPPGSIAAEFAEAGSAKDLEEAARRWTAFLKRHPPEEETEDAVQKRYIDAARYELIRVNYLLGSQEEGDRLFRAADPLGLKP